MTQNLYYSVDTYADIQEEKRQRLDSCAVRGTQGFYASFPLLVLAEKARRILNYNGILNLRNTAVGGNGGCVIFYGHTVAILFCVLYTLVNL
jgi:hypothetical protein